MQRPLPTMPPKQPAGGADAPQPSRSSTRVKEKREKSLRIDRILGLTSSVGEKGALQPVPDVLTSDHGGAPAGTSAARSGGTPALGDGPDDEATRDAVLSESDGFEVSASPICM